MTDEAKKVIDALKRCSINDSDAVIDAIDLIENLSKELEKYKKQMMIARKSNSANISQ